MAAAPATTIKAIVRATIPTSRTTVRTESMSLPPPPPRARRPRRAAVPRRPRKAAEAAGCCIEGTAKTRAKRSQIKGDDRNVFFQGALKKKTQGDGEPVGR